MTEGLVTAFERSTSYDNTRRVYSMLADMPTFTPIQLQRLETATKDNGQVKDAALGPNAIPDLISKLISERLGLPSRSLQRGKVHVSGHGGTACRSRYRHVRARWARSRLSHLDDHRCRWPGHIPSHRANKKSVS